MDLNERINQLVEKTQHLEQINVAALNVIFRIKDAAKSLGCEADDGMAMLDYLIETARAAVMVNQKNVELKSQLVAVQDSVVHGKCANSEPCATFCEAIATRKMFKQLQADRDAYRKLADSMSSIMVKHKGTFTDKELKGAQHHLAAHDAEVGLKTLEDFEEFQHEIFPQEWNDATYGYCLDEFRKKLRAKTCL